MGNENSKGMICPVCGKAFASIHDYANHMMQHSQDAQREAAEAERKALEEQRQRDSDQVKLYRQQYKEAYKRYADAAAEYNNKYHTIDTEDERSESIDFLKEPLSILLSHWL